MATYTLTEQQLLNWLEDTIEQALCRYTEGLCMTPAVADLIGETVADAIGQLDCDPRLLSHEEVIL